MSVKGGGGTDTDGLFFELIDLMPSIDTRNLGSKSHPKDLTSI